MKRSAVVLSCVLLSTPVVAQEVFENPLAVRWVVPEGNGTRDVKAQLWMEDESVVLRSMSGEVLRALPYESLKSVSHTTTRHRRWVSGLLAGTLVHPLGFGLLLTKGHRHYVTFLQDEVATVVRLDHDDCAGVLEAFASRKASVVAHATR